MDSVQFVAEGQSDWRIINTSPNAAGAAFAVEELRKYVKRISGCDLSAADTSSPVLTVGLRADFSESDAALLPSPAEGYDGYALCIAPRRILIAGDNPRGVVYGIYDLLERMGCRFFYPQYDPNDPEVVPSTPDIRLAPGRRAVASPLKYRVYNSCYWFFDIDPEYAKAAIDIAAKQRYNAIGWQCHANSYPTRQYEELKAAGVMDELNRRALWLHGPGHSFNLFMPNQHFESHPEWFGMRDGKRVKQVYGGAQFCWSHPEARKVLIDNLEQFVRDVPELKVLASIGFDGGPACECPECLKTSPADLSIGMMNDLIERLCSSAPHVAVETIGGYPPVHEPPKNVEPDPALRVIWAHWGRNHAQPGYDDPRYGWLGNLETWRKFVNNQITLCQYYADNFASPWIAAPYILCMEGDRRYVLDRGVDGWYMLIYPKGYWWNHGVNAWLGGVGFYDAGMDLFAALRDYALQYFGPEAGPFLAAYYEQWARQPSLSYETKHDSSDYVRATLAMQREAWIDPAVAAASSDPIHAYRVAKVEKLHQFAERAAETWFWKQRVQRARAAGDFDDAEKILQGAREHVAEFIEWLWKLDRLRQGLVDGNEIPGFLGMILRNWLDEEAKAIGEKSTRVHGLEIVMDSMEMLPPEVMQQNSDN